MQSADRLVEERMTWFWHDHFATSVAKVRAPYLMYQQHLTLRAHATGNFADLLKAVAKDPAMLVYLDGITNTATERNENFGRECLELFTMGREAGTRRTTSSPRRASFTGWAIDDPRPSRARAGSGIHGARCSCPAATTPGPRRCSVRPAPSTWTVRST